ncbi:hypothetical protein TNCV_589931 [Trichonephila clavipes]|nr:hypothetical protein TNCV_589931 [Trichonephila clavipes]
MEHMKIGMPICHDACLDHFNRGGSFRQLEGRPPGSPQMRTHRQTTDPVSVNSFYKVDHSSGALKFRPSYAFANGSSKLITPKNSRVSRGRNRKSGKKTALTPNLINFRTSTGNEASPPPVMRLVKDERTPVNDRLGGKGEGEFHHNKLRKGFVPERSRFIIASSFRRVKRCF